MPTRKEQPVSEPIVPPQPSPTLRALDYAKKIIQNYESAVKASGWTGVNLEAVGFCQDTNYRDALATIDRLARGEVVL